MATCSGGGPGDNSDEKKDDEEKNKSSVSLTYNFLSVQGPHGPSLIIIRRNKVYITIEVVSLH